MPFIIWRCYYYFTDKNTEDLHKFDMCAFLQSADQIFGIFKSCIKVEILSFEIQSLQVRLRFKYKFDAHFL